MKIKKTKIRSAFSLAEVVVALTIAAMVSVAAIGIYSSVNDSAMSITRNFDKDILPKEILQRIAEDIDKLATPGSSTTLKFENKIENGFQTARLIIDSQIYNKENRAEPYETVIWQTNYDPDTTRLTLYRSHSGLALQDKLFDQKRSTVERESFIPLTTGISLFKIHTTANDIAQEKWDSEKLPKIIIVSISFAEPTKNADGILDVPEENLIKRSIAVDRTKKIPFKLLNIDANST